MKKIMFNDKYRLTEAVLEGRKTQTRRIVKNVDLLHCLNELEDEVLKCIKGDIVAQGNALYNIREVVAIAQRYSDIEDFLPFDRNFDIERGGKERAGWDNKMFVEAMYMPHHIRITDVRVERLQDISNENCIAEGIYRRDDVLDAKLEEAVAYTFHNSTQNWLTPKEAYAALIDKISGKGTWDANPFVYVYEFELVD